ncbi:hypothetical protein [Nocardiopsis sp. NPDC006938]|uniref:hypothetical protein n=1 Tax=Nocardiopsis sp. NPDC006938 TaxID=3364337 RepID=UPI0036C4AA3E
MHHLGIDENPDMTGVRYLVSAARDECPDCVHHWASQVAADTENRIAILHLAAGAYTAATTRCGWTWEDLTTPEGDSVLGYASQFFLYSVTKGWWADAVTATHALSPLEAWQVLSDALYLATLPASTPALV